MNKLISIDDLTIDQINDIVKIAKIYKDGKLIPTFNLNPVIAHPSSLICLLLIDYFAQLK